MLSRALPIMLLLSIPTLGFGQARAVAPSIVGVWTLAETVWPPGAIGVTNTNPQPSLYIFTNKHYSVLSVNSTQPRPKFGPLKTPSKPTDAEKIARYEQWDPFTANAGTYEIKGTTLTRRHLVAMRDDVMSGPPNVAEFKLEGDTLWLIFGSIDAADGFRAKLIRVE